MKNYKFSIRLLLITLGLLLCIQMPTFAANKGKSTATNVRIRKGPSTQTEVIDVLAEGEEVEIVTEEGDWYKVKAKGHTGYVSKSLINVNEESNKPQDTNAEENKTEENTNNSKQNNNNETNIQNNDDKKEVVEQNLTKTYKVSENATVYFLPVLTSETIGEIKKSETVTLLDNAGLWVYVQSSNIKGWVRIDKLSAENGVVDNTVNNQNNDNTNVDNTQNTENNEQNTQNNAQNDVENNQTNKPEENTTTNNQQSNFAPKTMYVKGNVINVRSKSNTSSDIVTSVQLNEEVKVVGEENGWYKVEVKGKSGFIRNDLLSDKKTEISSRNNNLDRTQQVTTSQTQATTQVIIEVPQTEKKEETQTVAKPVQTTTTQSAQTTTTQSTTNKVTGEDVVAYAKKFLGYKYIYGAAGPNAFDCSGFTMYVYKHFGYSLSHSSKIQATEGRKVTGELQPGDLLIFRNGGSQIGHVGIYIGNNQFIHASTSTTGVIISNLSSKYNRDNYVGARRVLK